MHDSNPKNPNNPSLSLSLGFSPCPNDTFMFDALVNGKITTENLSFDVQLLDVESLNQSALKGELDVTKISFAVFPLVADKYELLTSGSALGFGVGPLLISKKVFADPRKEIKTVAIPGRHTTANFLLSMFYPDLTSKVEMLFSEIEQAVLDNRVDAGVIIHENRFTYEAKGLKKISDLGEQWEKKTGHPVPLGGIAVRKSLNPDLKQKINRLLKESVEYAFTNPDSSKDYVKKHSQEMSEEVMAQHIKLYVNKLSIDIGPKGKEAIIRFLHSAGMISSQDIFIRDENMIHEVK